MADHQDHYPTTRDQHHTVCRLPNKRNSSRNVGSITTKVYGDRHAEARKEDRSKGKKLFHKADSHCTTEPVWTLLKAVALGRVRWTIQGVLHRIKLDWSKAVAPGIMCGHIA